MSGHPLMAALRTAGGDGPVSIEYTDEGDRKLGVAARMAPLGWTMIVEQPTSEADANATVLQRQLVIAISVVLLLMILAGYLFGRQFITPILTLQRGTQALAAGHLEERVDIRTGDEFAELGQAFNTMADKLIELQENIKRQERQAMFGRIAAGLVHDLAHPVQNIGNSTRLLLRDDVDPESREMFRRTIERELGTLRHFMDDLRNIVKPKPIERFPMDVNGSIAEIVESMRGEGDRVGVAIETRYASGPLMIEGDHFALGRVYRNLITNAIQATEQGGRVTIATARVGDLVEVSVEDTGSGIPADRLAAIFEDFVTTKRRGLGLGLAISKRIVEQLDGTIAVESEVGRGTKFTLRFPARDDDGDAGGGELSLAARRATREGAAMFRTVVKTDALEVDDQTYPVTVLRTADAARIATVQRRNPARTGRPDHPRRRLGDQPRGQDGAARAGDALQPDAGGQGHGGLRHPAQTNAATATDAPRRRCAGRLLSGENGVFQLLRDSRLDHGLRGNLDRLAGGRVAAHARLALLNDQLHHPGQHELARALQLLFRQHRELVEVLTGLRALHLEPLGEVRKELRFAHSAGVSHRVPHLRHAPDMHRRGCARANDRRFHSKNAVS